MRRSRLLPLLGGTLLAAVLLPSVALAAAPTASTTSVEPNIRLRCALVIPAARPLNERVVCRWTPLAGVDLREFRIVKRVDAALGRPRHVVATVAPDAKLVFVDHHIRRGHIYTYRVVAIGTNGSHVGLSNAVSVRVGWNVTRLALGCAYVIDSNRQGAACHWSKAGPRVARYVLVRAVDGGARERIYRTGADGRRSFFDTGVAAGQSVQYRVFGLARDGRVLAVSRPDTVVVPTIVTP